MAGKTISQRIALEGGKEIREQLLGLGEAGEKAFEKISGAAKKAGEAGSHLKEGIGEAQKAIAEAREASTHLSQNLSELGAAFKTVTISAAAVGAAITGVAGTLMAMAHSGAETADAVGKTAAALGMTTQEYGRLQFAAEQSGVSSEQFMGTISRLNKEIASTKDSTNASATALGKLGVSVKESSGELRPTEEIIKDIADAFKAMPNGAEKSATAIELFGKKAGPRLIPLLNEGRAGIHALGADAEALGLVFTDAQVKIGTDMNDALSRMGRAIKAVRDQIGLMFSPVITQAADAFTEAIRANREVLIEFGRALVETVGPVITDFVNLMSGQDDKVKSGWMLGLRDAAIELGRALWGAVHLIIVPALNALAAVLNGLLAPFNLVFGTHISAQMLIIAVTVGRLSGAFALLTATFRTVVAAWGVLKLATWASTIATVTTRLSGLIAVVRGLGAAVMFIGGLFGGLALPITAAIIAVGLLAYGLSQLDWKRQGEEAWQFGDHLSSIWDSALAKMHEWGRETDAGFHGYVDGLKETWTRFWNHVGALWDSALAKVHEWGQAFTEAVRSYVQAAKDAWHSFADPIADACARAWRLVKDLGQNIVDTFWDAVESVKQAWHSLGESIHEMIEKVKGWLHDLLAKAKDVAQKVASAASGGGGDEPAAAAGGMFSRGGAVWGAGTSTSDSIAARLSSGEYVIRASAVKHYGSQLFSLLNRMRLPRGGIPSFSLGGLVESMGGVLPPAPRLAAANIGGGSSSIINLTIGNETFRGLMAPQETADRLVRHATSQQIKSAGRKPGWYS